MKEKSNAFIKCELNQYPDFGEQIPLNWYTLKTIPYYHFLNTYSLQSQNFNVIAKIIYYTKKSSPFTEQSLHTEHEVNNTQMSPLEVN